MFCKILHPAIFKHLWKTHSAKNYNTIPTIFKHLCYAVETKNDYYWQSKAIDYVT